jgi:V/A-type H+-transporting ATPase subunit B
MKFAIEYNTINSIQGPLVIVDKVRSAAYNEIVQIRKPNGDMVLGQVLESSAGKAVVQVFGSTEGLNISHTSVSFLGETMHIGVSESMLGRVFDGKGKPKDGLSEIIPEEKRDINGEPINPVSRGMPGDFIQTGISSIDCLYTLVRGQKLPIFSSAGLSHNELAAQITRQAKVRGKEESFAVVFAGIGILQEDAKFFMKDFSRSGALKRTVAFINYASDPSVERIMTPRLALTTAEFLAFEKHMHVLVILTDMTMYAEALREVSSAREEVPGRRGYPGYMYTDFASIYERAGIVGGNKGSITQLPILTMPAGDLTHPIVDLTGYITEGQMFLDKELADKGVYPPIHPSPKGSKSLSRLKSFGIGTGKTREDHGGVADQLIGMYARALDARNLSSIVGAEALSASDKLALKFGEEFEMRFINQGINENRDIETTLGIGWDLLSMFDKGELTRIKPVYIEKYYKGSKGVA